MKLGKVCSTICHIVRILKEKSSETETDTFILLPSFELRKGTYVFNVLTYYSPLDVAINHISSQFLCSAVLPQNCGGFFFVGLPGRWAKFRQGLAFSSFSKFPILGSSALSDRGQKGGDEIDETFAKNVDSAAIFGWFCASFSLHHVGQECKTLQDTL